MEDCASSTRPLSCDITIKRLTGDLKMDVEDGWRTVLEHFIEHTFDKAPIDQLSLFDKTHGGLTRCVRFYTCIHCMAEAPGTRATQSFITGL
jgi:hypothetical protein